MNRKIVAAVIATVASFLVVAALAVPVVQITVQQLGAGSSDIISPVGRAYVNHVFSIKTNGIVLDAVRVAFDKTLPAGSYIVVELRDDNGNILSSGSVTLQNDLAAGAWVTVDLAPDLDIWHIMQYDKIDIVVSAPEVTP